MPVTTTAIPREAMDLAHAGVRPWNEHGSSVEEQAELAEAVAARLERAFRGRDVWVLGIDGRRRHHPGL